MLEKMYLLFGADEGEPKRGAMPFQGVFQSEEDARAYFARHPKEWGQIAVLELGRLEPLFEWRKGDWTDHYQPYWYTVDAEELSIADSQL